MFIKTEEISQLLDDEYNDMHELYTSISNEFDYHELIFEAEALFKRFEKEYDDDKYSNDSFHAKIKFENIAYDILESDK